MQFAGRIPTVRCWFEFICPERAFLEGFRIHRTFPQNTIKGAAKAWVPRSKTPSVHQTATRIRARAPGLLEPI